MISNGFQRNVARLRQLCHVYSTTAVNVEASSKSYVDNLSQEWRQAKPFEQVPRITKFQMFRGYLKGGEFASLSFKDFLTLSRQRYGDIFIMSGLYGKPSMLITFNVDDFERVHRTEGPYPERPGAEVVMHYRTRRKDKFFEEVAGLMTSGKQWADFRTIVNPVLMQPRNAKLYVDPMHKVNDEFIERIRKIRDPETKEVPETFMRDINRLTFESISVVGLDHSFGLLRAEQISPEAELLFKSIQEFLRLMYDLGITPSFYRILPTPTYKRFVKVSDTIFDIISKYVHMTLERIDREGNRGNSVLEKLIQIDRKVAVVMVMDMLMAGVDTAASALSGILLCIAKSPEKQARLRKEILSVLPTKDHKFTIENMKHLPYLRACIKEALRIYPVTFGNLRETGMDVTLSGYQIPKGTQTIMCQNMLLSEERFFPRPKEFLPERWLRQASELEEGDKMVADNLNPFIYLPFGFGPRSCVGKRIVDLELELTLGNLVRHFNIEFNYPTDNAFRHYFINSPVIPLQFKFTDL